MAKYVKGQVVRLGATYVRASTGVVTDPTIATFFYKTPAGGLVEEVYGVSPNPERTSEGVYFRDLTLNEVGNWPYGWTGVGDVTTAAEDSLSVMPSQLF